METHGSLSLSSSTWSCDESRTSSDLGRISLTWRHLGALRTHQNLLELLLDFFPLERLRLRSFLPGTVVICFFPSISKGCWCAMQEALVGHTNVNLDSQPIQPRSLSNRPHFWRRCEDFWGKQITSVRTLRWECDQVAQFWSLRFSARRNMRLGNCLPMQIGKNWHLIDCDPMVSCFNLENCLIASERKNFGKVSRGGL